MSEHTHEHPGVPVDSVNFAAEKVDKVFILKSSIMPKNLLDIMPDRMKELYEKAPESVKYMFKYMFKDSFTKASSRVGEVYNWVGYMLTKDAAGIVRAYTSQANQKIEGGKSESKRPKGEDGLCMVMTSEDECMPEDHIRASFEMNITMTELRSKIGDWNGTPVLAQGFDGETALQEAKELVGDVFDTLFPPAGPTPSPITKEEMDNAKMTPERRAALIEKFGEKAIADLEAKMGKKKV